MIQHQQRILQFTGRENKVRSKTLSLPKISPSIGVIVACAALLISSLLCAHAKHAAAQKPPDNAEAATPWLGPAGTVVDSDLITDTVWTRAGSPYTVTLTSYGTEVAEGLICDPTFHQFDAEWIAYEVRPEVDAVRVRIIGTDEPHPVVVALELPALPKAAYAEAIEGEALLANYQPGISLADQPLSVASAFDHQFVLLEWPGGDGELVLYPSPPLGALLGQALARALLGVRAIFVDALSMPGLGGWPVAILSYARRRTQRSSESPRQADSPTIGIALAGSATGCVEGHTQANPGPVLSRDARGTGLRVNA
jgi:hypothetical protein